MSDPGDHLDRVRALLAKAHATEFDAEAEAFMAKAQALMTRHAIDELMLEDAEAHDGRSRVVCDRSIDIPSPYARVKFLLLGQVAAANRCRTVYEPRSGVAHGLKAFELKRQVGGQFLGHELSYRDVEIVDL